MKYDYIVDGKGRGTHTDFLEAIIDAHSFWSRLRRRFRKAHLRVNPGTFRPYTCLSGNPFNCRRVKVHDDGDYIATV